MVNQQRSTPNASSLAATKPALKLAQNDDYRKRTRHLEAHFHYVSQNAEQGEIDTRYIPTHTNVADIMTKGLPLPAHTRQIEKLGLSTI